MRVLRIIAFWVFVFASVPLFAQGGRTGTSSSSGIGDSSSFSGVTNISAQAAAQGTFIGGGAPSAFVGIDEIYTSSSATRRSATSNTRRATTTSRPVARATAQRRTTQPGAARSNLMGNNSQFIRAVTSIDFDVPTVPALDRVTMSETLVSSLKRIEGIQDSRVTFQNSPTGTTAVLTGTVASKRESDVAKQYLLMEPGISRVENLLEIR